MELKIKADLEGFQITLRMKIQFKSIQANLTKSRLIQLNLDLVKCYPCNQQNKHAAFNKHDKTANYISSIVGTICNSKGCPMVSYDFFKEIDGLITSSKSSILCCMYIIDKQGR